MCQASISEESRSAMAVSPVCHWVNLGVKQLHSGPRFIDHSAYSSCLPDSLMSNPPSGIISQRRHKIRDDNGSNRFVRRMRRPRALGVQKALRPWFVWAPSNHFWIVICTSSAYILSRFSSLHICRGTDWCLTCCSTDLILSLAGLA